MKKIVFMLVLFASTASGAQGLNDYKYALVPAKFSIFKNDDYSRLNTIAKMFMQKYGFETYLSSEAQPSDFVNINCNKVYVDLTEKNTMFLTKVIVVIKDCDGKILATSEEGRSREKNYQVAYNEAVRNAFNSFPALASHVYTPKSTLAVNEKLVVENAKAQDVVEQNPNVTEEKEITPATLFAQPILNGYQIIDSEPKVILKIYKTSDKNVYTAIKGSIQGILIAKNGGWFFEYYQNDALVSEKIDVRL